jgi:ribosomal protein S18 acetylase RimI-like enzyme
MNDLFRGPGFSVRLVAENDIPSILAVYRQCEDFLALGPVPVASLAMVLADIAHSREAGGCYCGIRNEADELVGVLDFIPRHRKNTAFLELLMIALPHRRRGLGTAVLAGLEAHLKRVYGTRKIESGVQVNNEAGIRFWRSQGFVIGRRARKLPDKTIAYEMKKRI